MHRMMIVFAVGRDDEQVFCYNNRIIFSTVFSINAQHGMSVQNRDVNRCLCLRKVQQLKLVLMLP